MDDEFEMIEQCEPRTAEEIEADKKYRKKIAEQKRKRAEEFANRKNPEWI